MLLVTQLFIENPMDLVLAHKRCIKTGEMLRLSLATQTSFTTALSEVARVILDKSGSALLEIGLESENELLYLTGTLKFESKLLFTAEDHEFEYARRLLKNLTVTRAGEEYIVQVQTALPRNIKISDDIIRDAQIFFTKETPDTFYEVIKNKNDRLSKIAVLKDEELTQSKIVNDQKTEFLSIASHELKTPLSIIKGFANLALANSEGTTSELKTFLVKIDQQADKLNKLINQLLDVSKIEVSELDFVWEEVLLNEYLQNELELIGMVIPDHKLTITLGEDVMVTIDRLKLEQVLSNLLNNAAKYSPIGSQIHVTTLLKADHVELMVRDQGMGMSPETATRIFDKFYRDKHVSKTHSGLGMGLYIAQKIVKAHGGKIWLESKEEGSEFYVTIPLATLGA